MESPTLHIRLLGAFELQQAGNSLPPLDSARAESLLAYLLLHQDAPQPRQRLAFLLWPDSTETQARTNLRHLLHTLRQALPDPERYLEVTSRTLQWRPESPFWLDVRAFAEAISRVDHGGDDEVAALRESVELYTGDLLEGCYDEWLIGERERLHASYLEALARLSALLESGGDHAAAIRYAERLLRLDPLREETYRLLMRLHDARGDRARALHVYHVCAATLERELGVEPAPATREVYETLLPSEPQPAQPQRRGSRLGGPPLVGRGPERTRLANLWRTSEEGRAQLVLVTGEPGIGKTRLVDEFRAWCAHRGALVAEARSYAAEGTLAYGTVVAWLRSERLMPRPEQLDRSTLTELARLLPELLAVTPGLTQPDPLAEDDQRQRLFDAAARALLAPGAPLLLIVDDLQWCDRESLQFLHYLLRIEPTARLLVAATARHEELDQPHPMNDLLAGLYAMDRYTELPLERLSRTETALLAEQIAANSFAEPDAERLYVETEGNPLFVVEALRAGWQSGGVGGARMSPKVQAAIEARLAQLSEPARDLVGLAATIGREFTTDVLVGASETGEDSVVRGLDELWRRRIVNEQGADAYDFSHDKIREVAYLGLSPARRRQLHLRVAQSLERHSAGDPARVSAHLAAHFERAGRISEAATWYERAAEVAQQVHANVETIRLLDRALDLLRTLPESPERAARELSVLDAMHVPLGWVEGWSSERLAVALQRALELARALEVEPTPSFLRSLAISSLSQRQFARAREYGEELRARGEHDRDDMMLVEADYVLGIASFWQGEFGAARDHFQGAVDRYRPEHRRVHILQYGLDPKVICLSRLGNTLWFLGYPEAAVKSRDAAFTLAGEINHPYSLATAAVFAAVLALDMRDHDGVRAYSSILNAQHQEHMTKPTQFSSEAIGGFVDLLDGRAEAGISRIQRALDETRTADHAPGMRAAHTRILLEACAVAADFQTGLQIADNALALGDAHRLWDAEIRRLRAEFLAALGAPVEDVEAELDQALATARGQGAKMLELRAAMSLFRHRKERGESPETRQARSSLAAIVDEIPEGRDSQDLREAATLLKRS